MKRTTNSLLLLCLMTSAAKAQEPVVATVMSKDLTDFPV